jgi:hypothetical protein
VSFTATIHLLGINPCVDVPEEIVSSLLRDARKASAPVQVKVALNGRGSFETNVVRHQGAYRLYVNTRMRQEVGVSVGDTVDVALTYDSAERMPTMPRALQEALDQNPRAQEQWRQQTRSRRREVLAYLNSLKRDESMERNVAKVVESLLSPPGDGSQNEDTGDTGERQP